ncbi:MAG: hypothetical protein IJV85_03820 [Clostridia bacterium]|nr:hypothetical protein [Clostridia bacterium]
MRGKLTRRTLCAICAVTTILSITGVYATWEYASEPPEMQTADVGMTMGEWKPEVVLPDDTENENDHTLLVEALVNGVNKGLNTSNSYLNQQISTRDSRWGRDTLGSMAITQGDDLEELFQAGTKNLSFLIQWVDENNDGTTDYYYIFTTDVDLGEKGAIHWLWGTNTKEGKPTTPIGEYIYPIYRTRVEKNASNQWEAVASEIGSAKSAWYEESRSNMNATQIPSFDPDTWAAGDLTATS